MTPELIQDASVTLVAVAAAVVIARRVMAIAAPSKSRAGCSSCASPCPTAGHPQPAPIQVLRRSGASGRPRRS